MTPQTWQTTHPWDLAGPATVYDLEVVLDLPGGPVAIVTEVDRNRGVSVTNNSEGIVRSMVNRFGPAVRVIEHYGPGSYPGGRSRVETFDLVTLECGAAPRWCHLGATRQEALDRLEALDREQGSAAPLVLLAVVLTLCAIQWLRWWLVLPALALDALAAVALARRFPFVEEKPSP